MQFFALPLKGAYLIESLPHCDERGFFARTFCLKEFEQFGLITHFVQMSTSFNIKSEQIRGMHYQEAPYEETKVLRCTRGAIYDVIVDLRKNSPTYKQWFGQTLSAEQIQILYVPKGFAHGYKTLSPNTEIFYMMDEFYHPSSAKEIDPSPYFEGKIG